MHIYPRVRESERENESDAQCTHCNLAGKPFSASSSSSSSPYASFPLLYFDKLVKQSSADSTSSSSGLACLIIIIISIGIGIGFGFGIAIANVSISINVRFAAPFCIETCNQNFQIFSPCVCVCVQWAGGLATVCPAQTDTHAPSELQSAHNSTKNAVQFLNCEPAPAPAQTVTHYPWHLPRLYGQPGLPLSLWVLLLLPSHMVERVRKISAFWAQKQYVFQSGISIYVACCAHISANATQLPHHTYIYPCLLTPSPLTPLSLFNAFCKSNAYTDLGYTICTYLHLFLCCLDIGYCTAIYQCILHPTLFCD